MALGTGLVGISIRIGLGFSVHHGSVANEVEHWNDNEHCLAIAASFCAVLKTNITLGRLAANRPSVGGRTSKADRAECQ
jgi:hypothetical protein